MFVQLHNFRRFHNFFSLLLHSGSLQLFVLHEIFFWFFFVSSGKHFSIAVFFRNTCLFSYNFLSDPKLFQFLMDLSHQVLMLFHSFGRQGKIMFLIVPSFICLRCPSKLIRYLFIFTEISSQFLCNERCSNVNYMRIALQRPRKRKIIFRHVSYWGLILRVFNIVPRVKARLQQLEKSENNQTLTQTQQNAEQIRKSDSPHSLRPRVQLKRTK